jgi:hypothetical protein
MGILRLRVVADRQSAYRISWANRATTGNIAVDRSRTGEHASMIHKGIARRSLVGPTFKFFGLDGLHGIFVKTPCVAIEIRGQIRNPFSRHFSPSFRPETAQHTEEKTGQKGLPET